MKDPWKQKTSAVCDHRTTTGHNISGEQVKVLNQEFLDVQRKIKDDIHIQSQIRSFNRDGGYGLIPELQLPVVM